MQLPKHGSFSWSCCSLCTGVRLAFCRAKFIWKVLNVHICVAESRFCYTVLYFLVQNYYPDFVPHWNSWCQLNGCRSSCAGNCTAVSTARGALATGTLGSVDRRATVVLAPSRHNSAAMQQEFHSYFVSASVSRHEARVQNVLSAHFRLLWVDFQAVSLLMVQWSWLRFQRDLKMCSYTMQEEKQQPILVVCNAFSGFLVFLDA